MPLRFLTGLALVLCAAMPAAAAAPAAAEQPVSYANASDAELTALGAHWNDLSSEERQALLSEVKMRMARARSQGAATGVLRIKLRRRYGAVPPGAGNGNLRIRVTARKQGSKPVGEPSGQPFGEPSGQPVGQPSGQPFGVGFEQRTGRRSAPAPQAATPEVQNAAAKPADSD